MEPTNDYGTVVQKPKWQLRWGHILLALFFVVLIIIAYTVVHQIKTADKNSVANSNNIHTSTGSKTGSSSKSSSTKSTGSSAQTSTTSTTGTATSTSTSTNKSTTLTNTGPGNTIGLFVGMTALGTFAHYLYTKRRLGITE